MKFFSKFGGLLFGFLLAAMAFANAAPAQTAAQTAAPDTAVFKLYRQGARISGETTFVVMPAMLTPAEIERTDPERDDPEAGDIIAKLGCLDVSALDSLARSEAWNTAEYRDKLKALPACAQVRQVLAQMVYVVPVNGADRVFWTRRSARHYNAHTSPCIPGGIAASAVDLARHAQSDNQFIDCVQNQADLSPAQSAAALRLMRQQQCSLISTLPTGMFFRGDYGAPMGGRKIRGLNRVFEPDASDQGSVPVFTCDLGSGQMLFIRVQCGNPLNPLQAWMFTILPEKPRAFASFELAPRPRPASIALPKTAQAVDSNLADTCTNNSCNASRNNPWPVVVVSVAAIWCGYTALSHTAPCGRRERSVAAAAKPIGGPIVRPDQVAPALLAGHVSAASLPQGPPVLLTEPQRAVKLDLLGTPKGPRAGPRYNILLGRVYLCRGWLDYELCH